MSTEERYSQRYGLRADGKSSYLEQYKGRSNLLVQSRLIAHANYHRKRDNADVTILDFGSGEGRMSFVAEKMAEAGMNVHYVASDIVGEGLKTLQTRAQERGYEEVRLSPPIRPDKDVKTAYIGPELRKVHMGNKDGSMTITLVHSSKYEPVQRMAQLLKKNDIHPDITMAIFGVLSHIPRRQNRQETMQALWDATGNSLICTLPNRKGSHRSELAKYEGFRRDARPVGTAKEAGDILYPSGDKGELEFYHLYSKREILEDLKKAGVQTYANGTNPHGLHIGAANFKREIVLTDPDEARERYHDASRARHETLSRKEPPDYFIVEVTKDGIIPAMEKTTPVRTGIEL